MRDKLTIPKSRLMAIDIAKKNIKYYKEIFEPNKFEIIDLEDYLHELDQIYDLSDKQIMHTDYPDIFNIKSKHIDDVSSITEGIETSSVVNLYANLILSTENKK